MHQHQQQPLPTFANSFQPPPPTCTAALAVANGPSTRLGSPAFPSSMQVFVGIYMHFTIYLHSQLNNACASGSSGIFLCKQIIESGNVDLMLAVGFEKVRHF